MSYGLKKYGESGFGDNNILSPDIDAHTPDLMQYLPWYYQDNNTMTELQEVLSGGIGALAYHVADLDKQLFIDSSTWGIARWEKEFGLSTNMALTYEERREIIKAKLRGRGTTTIQMIKDTAEAFSGGEVNVIEYHGEYRFVVQFIGVKGIPRNMQGFIDMLESIKPAHLGYEFKYTYSVWDFISLTWEQAKENTWDDLRIYKGE